MSARACLYLQYNGNPPVKMVAPQAGLEHDAGLMLLVRAGDHASFAELFERYRAGVVFYLYRMVRNQAVAEELAQEVFLRVYRSRLTYLPAAKFSTWLFRIATHLALNSIRDGKYRKLEESLDRYGENLPWQTQNRHRTAEQELLYQANLREIRQAISALPHKQRAAVVMHKYHELAYPEIAEVLGCSESAVKSLLFRAYRSLRGRLATASERKCE